MLEIYNVLISLLILQRTDARCGQQANGVFVFGSNCLMCHCRNNEECDQTTGECPSGCAKFWYGPGCQYRDIAEGEYSRQSDNLPQWQEKYSHLANDGDPRTCSSTAEVQSNAKTVKPFWRVWFPTNETIRELQIVTSTEKMKYFKNFTVFVEYLSPAHKEISTYAPAYSRECNRHESDGLNNVSIIVLCNRPEVGNQVKIELGEFQTQLVLCDVRINGGRNIAFGRPTSQISKHRVCENNHCSSKKAVDGIDKGSWTECTFMDEERYPWWKVDLEHMATVWYIRILPGANQAVTYYQLEVSNGTSGVSKDIYNVSSVNSSQINETLAVTAKIVKLTELTQMGRLELCEVYVFGDCPVDLCGYECKSECHCKQASIWDKISGNCTYGCKDGWSGSRCNIPCASGYYGEECIHTCSQHCIGGKCEHVDGRCTDGCFDGWEGENCDEECDNSRYGVNCSSICSANCKGGYSKCSHVDGSCLLGCNRGWLGQRCDEACASGYYGEECKHTCSQHCVGGKCEHVDGQCTDGCFDGWEGENCDEECDDGKYGSMCRKKCSGNCQNEEICEKVHGSCPNGCKTGYRGKMCDQECDNSRYGINCSSICSANCNDGYAKCNHVNGSCLLGCKRGWIGQRCDQAMQKSDDSVAKLAGIIAGVAVFVAFGVIVAVLYFKRRKKRRGKVRRNETVELSDANLNAVAATSTVSDIISTSHENTYNNEPMFNPTKSPIPLSNLLAYVKANLTNGNNFSKQFQEIPYGMKHPSAIAVKPYNRGKNRYRDMYAYDHTRVVLEALPREEGSDYINANYIKGHFKDKAYIAAQGPTEITIGDFWRMIWEKDIHTIAMFTNLLEETKMKCIQYWPTVECSARYEFYTVYTESEAVYADFTIRKFKVSCEEEQPRKICQFNFTAWSDKSAPRNISSLLQFWRKVRRTDENKSHTWLVHCSAGVGHTGTFIALDILYDQCKQKGFVDVYQCVRELRDQRVNMVQTKDQYIFLHGLMIEAFILPSEPVPLDNFQQAVKDLNNVVYETGKTKFLSQYETMDEDVTYRLFKDENKGKFTAAKLEENRCKNRYKNVLPPNEFRPFLITSIPGCTNYINAVFIPSYCNDHGYIITQTPMENTAIDCCRLVYEQEVKVIVTFPDNVKKKVGKYLPENGTIKLGPFTVTKISEEDENFYIRKTYAMAMAYNSEKCQLTQLIYKCWPADRITPSDAVNMLHFMQEVECNRRAADNKPVLVQCLDGSEKSGLFATLMNILERARLDNEVSIPQVIRQLRIRREQLIPNFEQFKFCYDVLLCHVESKTMYVNM